MGYFANGTEGMMYEVTYCDKCVHSGIYTDKGCAVWMAHMIHNYDDCNNPKSILHILIPFGKNGNKKCKMFIKRSVIGK